MPDLDLTTDHKALDDDIAARRYFQKFERITALMAGVSDEMETRGGLSAAEGLAVARHVAAISASFRALAMKYLIAGRIEGAAARHLTIDLHESGFPVYQELVSMANDAAQAGPALAALPEADDLKTRMVQEIVGERRIPTALQYALSQRLYLEALVRGGLFFARTAPQAQWLADLDSGRRRYLLDWAVYDSQLNVPVVYLMEVEDAGGRALPTDVRRWPAVQAHLLAQSLGGLKLVTIARGVESDFADLHPKRLRRLHLGPMYSSAFTLQTGPIRAVLDGARAAPGDDWALAWTVEELESERVEVAQGWFSSTERQVFRLDPLSAQGAETGATRISRSLILPERPFQVLAEQDPEGFRQVRKYVVGRGGRVLVYD